MCSVAQWWGDSMPKSLGYRFSSQGRAKPSRQMCNACGNINQTRWQALLIFWLPPQASLFYY